MPIRSWQAAAAAAFFFVAAAPLGAQDAGMTLEGAVRYALLHNAGVVKQQTAVAQAEETFIKQHSAALPNLSGSLQNYSQRSKNLQGAYAIAGISQEQIFSQNTAQIGTNYTLDTGGLAFLQADADKAQLDAARATLRDAQDTLATNVTADYFAIAGADETVQLDQANVKYQQALVEIARAKERAGVAAGVDVLRAEAAKAAAQSTLIGDQTRAIDARETLAQFIAAPLETVFFVPPEVPQPPLPAQPERQLVRMAQEHRPDVAAANDALASAHLTRKGYSRELFPQVQFLGALGNQFTPTTAGPPGIAIPRGSPGFWQLQAVSSFSLPFVDYGARRSERLADDAQVAASQNGLEQARSQAELDVRQAYRGARTALEQLAFSKTEVRAAVDSARVARLQYENGIIAISDVLQAQQQARSAQTDLYNARVNYVEAIVKLRVALGVYDAPSAVADLR